MSFDRRRARTRDGLVDTILRQTVDGSPVTGYETLEVIGDVNPGEYTILFTEAGKLYLETPSGSGAAVELKTPFPLPLNARMQTAQAFNNLYMAFTDGINGLCPPLRYNGLTGVLGPVSQNPVGARWVKGRFAQVGDVVTDANQHWWRCTFPGVMGDEPIWPGQAGYFVGVNFVPATATSGATIWEEWTPGFEIYMPIPDISTAFGVSKPGAGTISGGKDLYVRLAYTNDETGEAAWSDPVIFQNTVANSGVEIDFRTVGSQLTQIAGIFKVTVQGGTLTVETPGPFLRSVLAALPGSDVVFANVLSAIFLNGQTVTVDTATNVTVGFGPQGAIVHGVITAAVAFSDYGPAPDSGEIDQENPSSAPGGPPMPRWLAELNLRGDDAFFPFAMNVYGAVVAHGDPAPTKYYLVGTTPPTSNVFIGVDPVTDSANTNFSRPSTVVSPDPAFVGTLAFSNPTYGNDGSTSTAAQGKGSSSEHHIGRPPDDDFIDTISSSSAIWSGLVAPPNTADQIFLFVDYGAFSSGPAGNDVTGSIQYTLDNGSNWLLVDSIASTSRARTVFKLALAGDQDYTHIKVRARVAGLSPEVEGTRLFTLAVYDIRTGVALLANAAAIGAIILRKTAAGIELNGPPIFSGETGLRYAVLIRRDDTDSPSPVDPASPIPIIFTNGEMQRVAILPPGGPTTTELIVALGEAGAQQAGPFFDIVVSDPVNPASSSIVKITRDGAGVVSATVKNAIGFQAGHQILAAGIGGGLDGSFALSAVDASINQIQWGQDGAALTVNNLGTVTEQQNNLRTGVDAPDNFFYLNFNDDFLSKSRDDTSLLIFGPAPNASDISFLPTLKKMSYVDHLGAFHLSQDNDPGNIDQSGGILLVESSKGGRGLCLREMTHGQIIAVKTNGGYELNTSDISPSKWNPGRLWELHGPPCAQMVGVGKDFFVFAGKEGAYFFAGADSEWISQELQGSEQNGSWNDIDWARGQNMWCAVDEDKKEVHFGVTTDARVDNGFPNEVFKLSYVGGWAFPEVLTRYGKLITSDDARKWSRDPVAARLGKYLKRKLVAPVDCVGDSVTTKIENNSANKPMATHQMTYALSGLAKLATYPLVRAERANGVVTAIITSADVLAAGKVLIWGAGTFNGTFSALTAVNNNDGTWTLTWDQAEIDETEFGGTLSTTLGGVRVAAFQPGRLDDNGAGYDSIYRPAYTQTGDGTILRFGGIRGTVRGTGKMLVRFVTEDANQNFAAQEVSLKENVATTQFALSASDGDPLDSEYLSPEFSNGAVPGSGFELIEVGVYANPWLSGSDV